MDQLALSPKQLAKASPLGEHRIRQLCLSDPTFPCFRNGNRTVIPVRAFEQWLEEQASNRVGYSAFASRKASH